MLPVGFETTISAGERPKTYALDRAMINISDVIYNNHTSPDRSWGTPNLLHNEYRVFPGDKTHTHTYITKLRGLSSRANYTDRAAAAGRRS
jgi:hypothetical protein